MFANKPIIFPAVRTPNFLSILPSSWKINEKNSALKIMRVIVD
jgi:hypothetical protein